MVPDALENARSILGEAGCQGESFLNAPADWATVQRGRDLFVPGWGGFDIGAALNACLVGLDSEGIPSVKDLRSCGYRLKYFPELKDEMIERKIQGHLKAPESLLARYIVQHRSFWGDARNANRLDEVETYWCDLRDARALKEDPRKLLNRLSRDRAVAQHPLIRFQHLFGQAKLSVDEEEGTFELSVLEDTHSVLRAAQELNNCAADYVRNIRQKRCALVVLRSKNPAKPAKLLAMGEWDLHDARWSQISEHSDEPVREDWLKMFKKMEDSDSGLFPVRSILPLPDFEATSLLQEVKDDTISMFSHEGTQCLDRLCNTSILGMEPCCGWPSLVEEMGEACHPETLSALLLWTLASLQSEDCELEDVSPIVERLLKLRADPDCMTDKGWNSLMFSVVAQNGTLVTRLLEAGADVDARAAESGRTALILACSQKNFALVCRLITASASLDVASRIDGRTAVLQAAGARVRRHL